MNDQGYNLILDTDSYKIGGHYNMYLTSDGYINSYGECRGGAKHAKQVFIGLQILLDKLSGVVVTPRMVDEAAEYCRYHFGNDEAFNFYGWMDIATRLGGKLPVVIEAVPEGTVVGKSNVLIQIRNTDPKHKWLVGYLETMLSRIWYPMAVATNSKTGREVISKYWELTSDQGGDAFGINFCLHGFGSRSATCYEAAGIADMAHLATGFMGTDTIHALKFARKYYDADMKTLAFSVPASEHSIMTFKGREGEEEIFESLLDKYPSGILSVVSDSYNIYDFTSLTAEKFKGKILAREGKTVFRPDSGDPVQVTLAVLNNLWSVFGGTINGKGFKVLNEKVGTLWGDGIDISGFAEILQAMYINKWSAEIIVFGMGSAMVQRVNRDTEAWAFKACAQRDVDGEWKDVYKDPVDAGDTSDFTKKSKRGVLALIEDPGGDGYRTIRLDEMPHGAKNILVKVFENGEVLKRYNFDEVRANCNK